MESKSYYNTRDLAGLTGLTPQRIRQLLAAGEITGEKVGRDWVIERDEALRWLSERGIGQPDTD